MAVITSATATPTKLRPVWQSACGQAFRNVIRLPLRFGGLGRKDVVDWTRPVGQLEGRSFRCYACRAALTLRCRLMTYLILVPSVELMPALPRGLASHSQRP